MDDYKERLIQTIGESLTETFDNDVVERVTNVIARALKDYDVTQAERALITYDSINETILNRFCGCLAIGGKSKLTIANYRRTAEKLCKTTQKDFTDMGVYDIRMFLAFEKERGIANRTLENTRANLSAFFQWMLKEEIISKNPCMNIPPIKYTDKVRLPFSALEIDALRHECKNNKERAIIELLLSSGVRVSELTNIKLSDIDFERLSVHITRGKGDKERTAYMSELARKHLIKYIQERNIQGEYLFYNKGKNVLRAGGVRDILNRIAKKANVENVHPHRFRRTFATELARRGMEVQEIQKLLGHSNINTTMEYVYTSDEQAHASYLKYSA